MGRRHSPEHYQAVIDDWRRRLLAVPWEGRGRSNAQLLAVTIGIGSTASDTTSGKQLWDAAASLHRAIVAVGDGSTRPDILDAWIGRYLLQVGPCLLISDALRRTVLARVRDARRRQTHADRGLRSARIELRKQGWAMLEVIRADLESATGGKISLRAVLEHIIEAYGSKQPLPMSNRGRGRKPVGQGGGDDLFAKLETKQPYGSGFSHQR
jgi:hypothetical protein